jgi:diguanylate cyclase (GGDEF)-like protein/PAS domain S-box-containing protein
VVGALKQRTRSEQSLEFSYRIIRLDGQIRHLKSVDVREHDALGRTTRIIITAMDVTESVLAQARVAASEELFRTAFASAPIGMLICDAANQCAVVDANAAFCELLGRSRESLLGKSVFELNHPDDRPAAHEQVAILLSGKSSTIQFEKRFLRADGSPRSSRVTATLVEDGGRRTTIAQVEDVTEHRLAEERLAYQAGHDALTGLPNRMLLVDRLEHALARRSRHPGSLVGVIFLDLDNFKTINDSLGHAVGDALLISVSRLIAGLIRPTDTIARFGGDEFVLALEDLAGVEQAEALARRISAALRQPLTVDGKQLVCSVSMGLAICGEDAATPDELLRNADTALYRAKREGRGRHVLFAHELRQEVLHQLQTAGELRRALAEGQLRLHFQPVVDLAANIVTGYEALIRWEHPQRGLLFPGEFLDIAHREKLTAQLGTWVLREALSQLAIWRRDGHDWSVSVNVSPQQLDSSFADQVAGALREADVRASHLILEMTEEAVVGDVIGAVNVLADLQQIGVRVAIDDFGTGYSSLSYVRNLPLNAIKIDRSFLTDLESDPRHVSVVQAIVDLAHGLGLVVVAEGVETWQQRSVLTKLGVEMGQGYLFSPALPPVDDPADMLASVQLPVGPSPSPR